MYGFSTSRFAASMTRFTFRGAEAGASTRPSTSVASSGGGGGGSKVAPPLLFDRPADAGAARPMMSRSAAATAAQSSLMWLRDDGILFRTPAGLADGLALKELARLPQREVRPSGRLPPWFPRSAHARTRRGGEASRCLGDVAAWVLCVIALVRAPEPVSSLPLAAPAARIRRPARAAAGPRRSARSGPPRSSPPRDRRPC